MNYLLTGDLHLTDHPMDEYRWAIFDVLKEFSIKHKINQVFFLGDIWDRRDRHSSLLVNRSVASIIDLQAIGHTEVIITAGNHDKPVNGPYFWEFLNEANLRYITKPLLLSDIWLLPFSSDPVSEWKDLDFKSAKAIFMHQTGQGVTIQDHELTSNNLPTFPEGVPVFSGDVHTPQEANGIVYVGTPYPIKFSESWGNRIILVKDDNFRDYQSVPVDIMQRAILDISSSDEMGTFKLNPGSQVRIRYRLTGANLANWPVEEHLVRGWCETMKINPVSIEAVLEGGGLTPEVKSNQIELLSPEEIIKMFCKEEKLSEDILTCGLQLVQESK
jgi:hypothetical protein